MEQCDDRIYSYCISCRTGRESRAAYLIQEALQIKSIAPVKVKREWRGNRWEQLNLSLLPGYIFAYSDIKLDLRQVDGLPHVLRVLKYADGNSVLCGRDQAFAFWLMRHNGIVGLSSAILQGDRVKVVSGPLKDLAGMITKVDKRRQIAKVSFESFGSVKYFWLSFEILRK